jgi:putative transposase
MTLAPQEMRTFLIASATWQRRCLLRSHGFCDLLLEVIRENRSKQRLLVHEFVFMREHIHMILTPAVQVSLEKAMQFVKGRFSYRLKKELGFNGEVWQKGYNDSRIGGPEDYARAVEYVWMNPVKAGLASRPEDYLYSSARLRNEVDPAPEHLRLKSRG